MTSPLKAEMRNAKVNAPYDSQGHKTFLHLQSLLLFSLFDGCERVD
jgi:hypothetical protein